MPVKPIPDGYRTVTPYLVVEGAAKLVEFMVAAFDAEDRGSIKSPQGKIMHGEVKIGDSVVMFSDAGENYPAMPTMLHLYVTDVDAVYRDAVRAGGTSMREPQDEFYGDRSGGVQDAFGNLWWITTHVEDVSPEEMERRSKAWMEQQKQVA